MHCSQECPWVKLLDWDSREMRETRLTQWYLGWERQADVRRGEPCVSMQTCWGPAGLRAVSLWGFAYTITQSRQLHKRRGCLLPHINRTCKQVFASAEGEFYIGYSKTKQENSCSIGSNCIPSILCEAVKSGGGKERAHMEWQGPPESESTTRTRSHQGVFWGAGWNILASHGGRDKSWYHLLQEAFSDGTSSLKALTVLRDDLLQCIWFHHGTPWRRLFTGRWHSLVVQTGLKNQRKMFIPCQVL